MLRLFRRKPEEQKPEQEKQGQEGETKPKSPLEFLCEQPTDGAWLETSDKERRKLFLPLTCNSILLGTSDECDAKLTENLVGWEKVREKHARIENWRGQWVLVSFDKNSPIFVNGKRTGENVLRDGWEIQLGENGIRFVFREAKPQG